MKGEDDIETRARAMRELLDSCPEQPPPIPDHVETEIAERVLTGFAPETCPCMVCESARQRRRTKEKTDA